MSDIPRGTRIDAYWNFHKDCWSIKSMETDSEEYGTVIGHVDRVLIDDPEFVVQEAGLKDYRRTGDRNVHAFIRGDLIATGDDAVAGDYRMWEFYYCPRDNLYQHLDVPFVFYEVPEGRPASDLNPDRVLLTPNNNYGLFDHTVSSTKTGPSVDRDRSEKEVGKLLVGGDE